MKSYISILLIVFFASCNSTNTKKDEIIQKTKQIETEPINNSVSDEVRDNNIIEEEVSRDKLWEYDNIDTFFVVIADTSLNYFHLQNKMYKLTSKLSIPIDTMGRYYNTEKNLIVLPDDDDDEMYAGAYYPRRFPSEHLSLEYFIVYQNSTSDSTIALLTGIYETELKADSALKVLQSFENNSFKIKAGIYIGCMH